MSRLKQNIFLIGPMGSGKTSIGKHLAELLDLEFYDCDEELERLTGASVNLIFDIEGESGFRLRESQMLQKLSEKTGALIATGGGVVCSEENRQILRSKGFVVYLKTSIGKQIRRLQHDKSRPLLQAEDRVERLQDLARIRNPLYSDTADLVFSARNSSVYSSARALSEAILERLVNNNPEKPSADS